MPSIVRLVSAMFVAMTTLRAPGGVFSKIFACTQFTPFSRESEHHSLTLRRQNYD